MSTTTSVNRPRLDAVDLTRGIIMILMALDHTRDFFGIPGQNPTNIATTTGALFFTRWITHICAPTFFLLTGTGAFLSLHKQTPAQLSRFLLTRGLWLIFLEAVVVRCLAYQFNFDFKVTLLLVLWALGWSMIVLSLLVRFPLAVPAIFGLLLIGLHNVFDGFVLTNPFLVLLHQPGFVLNTPEHVVFAAYPLIPWVGVTAIGYALGRVYDWDRARRRTFLLRLGLSSVALFAVLRGVNVYGDPARWAVQQTTVLTIVSFFNVTKYPPSLLFLLMTLGPTLLLLRALDQTKPRVLQPALIFGRVPMFYYILHFFMLHLLAVVVCRVHYGTTHWMFESPDLGTYPFTPPPGWGFSLPWVYVIWMFVVVLTYPCCRWYAALKQRRKDVWLSYL